MKDLYWKDETCSLLVGFFCLIIKVASFRLSQQICRLKKFENAQSCPYD